MKLVCKQVRESIERRPDEAHWVANEASQFSVVSSRAEEMTLRSNINYQEYLSPKTDRVYEG